MDDLDELYQQVILDHSRHPRNFHELADASGQAEGYNPVCGDRVTVFVKCDQDRIAESAFTGKGCAICTASASMMTQAVKGRTRQEAQQLFEHFHQLLTAEDRSSGAEESLGKLAAFAGVKKYPVRVKCATLPWHTMQAAFEQHDEPVSTE